MPGTFFGSFSSKDDTHAEPAGGNTGNFPLGHYLITPDGRQYRYTKNDGTVEVAGNLYQSTAEVANHTDRPCDVPRAVGATTISATLGATSVAADVYNEGIVHSDAAPAEGYAYRIRRAIANNQAHEAAQGSAVLTVNLEPDDSVQVALVSSTSDVTFTRNKLHEVIISPNGISTGAEAGISPGVAAPDRYYYLQVKGYAACLVDGTFVAGRGVMASTSVAGAVSPAFWRHLLGSGATADTDTGGFLADEDGTDTVVRLMAGVSATAYQFNRAEPMYLGVALAVNASAEYGIIDLNIP